MDFIYKEKWYRFCREFTIEEPFYLYIVEFKSNKTINDSPLEFEKDYDYKELKRFNTFNQMINSIIIDKKRLIDILASEECEITGRD